MGNSSGMSLELVGKSDVFVWEFVGNAHGLLGNEWGIDQELLRIIWETVDIRRGCWKMHCEFAGNSYELFGKPLVFIGNPWRISGDFRLGIHSLGEGQIQTEHTLTHAISLTKPRFPFHVLTGSLGYYFPLIFLLFFQGAFGTVFWYDFGVILGVFFHQFSTLFSS